MKAFFRSFLGALFALFVFSILILFVFMGLAAASEEPELELESGSVLHLTLQRPIVDRHQADQFKLDLNSLQPVYNDGLNNMLKQIAKAKMDSRIVGIFIDNPWAMSGLANLQELREALEDFKESGKWIKAYADNYGQKAYYLASVADEIYVQPEGLIELKGLSTNIMFLREFLERAGVDVQVIRPKNNRFKSAVEPFLLDSMSMANEIQSQQILNSIWSHVASDICRTRGLDREQLDISVNQLDSRNPSTATKAGLITGAKYRDEFIAQLLRDLGLEEEEDLELISLSSYRNAEVQGFVDREVKWAKETVAVIYADGDIIPGKGDEDSIGSDDLAADIAEARKDSAVKAIVLRINSPGGSASASDVIWREMSLAKETKPVVVSMGNVAASGGYYISCNADRVLASEMTITGSIGVFGMIPNAQELSEEMLGIHHDGVKTHRFSNVMDLTRPMEKAELAFWQEAVDKIYDGFTTKVSEGRGMSVAQVDSIGQGRVWSGVDAMQVGLIDEFGGLNKAIEKAAELAELDEYKVRSLPESLPLMDQLIKDFTGQVKVDPIKSLTGEDVQMYKKLKNYKRIMQLRGLQTRLPYELELMD